MNPRISLSDLVARLASADHTIAYFNTPLPEPLLDGLRLVAGRRGRGSLDLVVEQIDDVAYLKKLNSAGASVYNGVGLPRETLEVDRIQGYWLATDIDASRRHSVAANNAPDLYVKLLWRRFGLAVSYEGELKGIYPDTGFFLRRVGRTTRAVVSFQPTTKQWLTAGTSDFANLARHNRFIDADFVVRGHRKSVSHDASRILRIISTRIER